MKPTAAASFLLAFAFMFLGTAQEARADTVVTFELKNVVFDDGSSASGTFTVNETTGLLVDWNIAYTGGTSGHDNALFSSAVVAALNAANPTGSNGFGIYQQLTAGGANGVAFGYDIYLATQNNFNQLTIAFANPLGTTNDPVIIIDPCGCVTSTVEYAWNVKTYVHLSPAVSALVESSNNQPPVAVAGANQAVRPGTVVQLNGSGSYDDNTPTDLLQYAWKFVSIPAGSAATLSGASTMTPSFVPDAPGTYTIQLTVTDQGGLSSVPSQVTVGEDPAPTASAGADQLVVVKYPVTLTGSGFDPAGNPLTYAWTFSTKPSGSAAQFAQPNSASTTLIPDLPGIYVVTLTPADFLGPGAPASAQITATTATTHAEIEVQAAATVLQGLPSSAVTTGGNRNALMQLLGNAVAALQAGNPTGARQQLLLAISRTDGCALRGAADGNGPSRDWITTCSAQNQVYSSLMAALAFLGQ